MAMSASCIGLGDQAWISGQRLHCQEQIGHLHAQAERDPVERFDRRRVLAQLDLRKIAKADVRSLGHLRERQSERLAPFADGGAERFAQGFFEIRSKPLFSRQRITTCCNWLIWNGLVR